MRCGTDEMWGDEKSTSENCVFAALDVYIHDLLSEYQFKLSTVYIIAGVLLKIQGDFSSDPSGLLPRVYRKLQALMITFFLECTVTRP